MSVLTWDQFADDNKLNATLYFLELEGSVDMTRIDDEVLPYYCEKYNDEVIAILTEWYVEFIRELHNNDKLTLGGKQYE